MAVKQNNTEANTNASPSNANNATNGNSSTMSNINAAKNVTSGHVIVKTANSNQVEIDDNNEVIEEQCGFGLNVKSNKNNENEFPDNATKELTNILKIIQLVENAETAHQITLSEMIPIYKHFLNVLSTIRFPREVTQDVRKFYKESMNKIGDFFAKPSDKKIYLYYLRWIWQIITESQEPPSSALAIIFGIFDNDMIFEAVQMLMEHQISEKSIRQTVNLLCTWLSSFVYCQNIHQWINAILQVLDNQQKHALIEEIALDNIDGVFGNLFLPILRPKLMPVCLVLLKSTRNPQVLHKIVPRIPKVFKYLKKQPDTKQCLQNIAEIVSALMLMFPGYDEFYQPVVECLKECQLDDTILNGEIDVDNWHLTQFQSNAKAGLVNLGNTCYMNSVLQALANTKEFSHDILLCKSSSPLIKRIQEQIALMLYSYRNELTPSHVLKVARPSTFATGLQQDSSEFLSYLLDSLHVQETTYRKSTINTNDAVMCAKVSTTPIKDEINNSKNDINPNGAAALCNICNDNHANSDEECSASASMITTTETNLSTIDKAFTGKQVTTLRCLTCGFKSLNEDIFRDLQLSFPEPKNDCVANYSVQDLLDFYCSPEKLDGDNQYFCERCKTHTDAERSVRVIKAPKNLIITLKHFKYDHKYHKRAKLMHKVFHDEKVYVKVCATDSLEEIASAHYDLYASVVHSGYSMDSGHYYTFAADATNRWFKFNDSIVTPSKAEELHNLSQPNTPYILFYQMTARSNERTEITATTTSTTLNSEAGAISSLSNPIIKVEMPIPLKLEELPINLRDYVNRDNSKYNEELQMRRLKNAKTTLTNTTSTTTRNIYRHDDSDNDDDGGPTAGGGGGGGGGINGCGDNALAFNINRFVF